MLFRSRTKPIARAPEYYVALASATKKVMDALSRSEPVVEKEPVPSRICPVPVNPTQKFVTHSPWGDAWGYFAFDDKPAVSAEDSPFPDKYFWKSQCIVSLTQAESLAFPDVWKMCAQTLKTLYGDNVQMVKPLQSEEARCIQNAENFTTGELTLPLCTSYEPAVFLTMLRASSDLIDCTIGKCCDKLKDKEHANRMGTWAFK